MTKALHCHSPVLLEEHMNHCVVDAARWATAARQVVGDTERLRAAVPGGAPT